MTKKRFNDLLIQTVLDYWTSYSVMVVVLTDRGLQVS